MPHHVVPAELRPLGDRERFVAFAFAAAELLVEASVEGEVLFAAGAFRMRYDQPPEAMVGRPAVGLIAAEDQAAFASALALLPSRGRFPPTRLRLSNRDRTPLVASGLYLSLAGQAPRLCLAFSSMPATPGSNESAVRPAAVLGRHVEQQVRASGTAGAGQLGLIEISGPIPPDLLTELAALLDASRPGTLEVAEFSPGCFGLLSRHGEALPRVGETLARLEVLLPGQSLDGRVRQVEVPLALAGLTPVQAVRAVRHGLAVFAREGVSGVAEAGFGDGLAAFVAKLGRRTHQLTRAVEERRFHLDYQPVLTLDGGALHHYEALLRPDKKLVGATAGPAEFVSLAETMGLTEKLDLAVADCAMAALPGLEMGQRIAINLSGLSVQSERFRATLLSRIAACPLAPARLMVELTESVEIDQEAEAARTLVALRELGIPVCLDDFGAGAAAFRYLKAFAVDYVKVDGTFVQAALDSERDRSFVSSMVDLSLAVGAKVIAERIETAAHAELMRSLGVGYGQGWHLGRPGPLRRATSPPASRRKGAREQWG